LKQWIDSALLSKNKVRKEISRQPPPGSAGNNTL
jgi:hypothetical protein